MHNITLVGIILPSKLVGMLKANQNKSDYFLSSASAKTREEMILGK